MSAKSNSVPLGTVAVIGGCGFLGHHIVKQLLADKTCTAVHVMCRKPDRNMLPGASYHKGDITSRADVDRFLSATKPNVIINTASPLAYIDHVHKPDYGNVNIGGNNNVLSAAKALGVTKAYVYTSSAPIIAGEGGAYDQADELHPTLADTKAPGDPYHVAKAEGDALVLASNDPSGLRTATIRPTAMYGEGDQQMVHHLLQVYRNGQQMFWLGDNTPLMDVVYVGSVARAHILAAQALLDGIEHPPTTLNKKVEGEAFNITDDAPMQPWTFFRLFWIEMGDTTPLSKVWMIPAWAALMICFFAEWWAWIVSFGKSRPKTLTKERIEFALYTRTYDVSKAKERLGYKPIISRHEGIRRAVKWALNEWPQAPLPKKIM